MLNEQAMTILLAEDDAGHARLIEKNLRRANLSNQIIKFEDGQQLVDCLFDDIKYNEPHCPAVFLVVLDLNLPGLSGYQVLERMKSDRRTRHVPVVILTTTEDPQEIYRCYRLGCNVYITKPVEYDQFCEAIHRLGNFLSIVKVPEKDYAG
jgi:CheY-like chemotaxis protein